MSDSAPVERVDVRVRGRVQGVSFRAHARAEARRLGLVGWVRNEPDGSVRAVAEGPRPALEAFLAWCHRGSPAAAVSAVEPRWEAATGESRTFDIRRVE